MPEIIDIVAIHGRLVPLDPADEPLARLRAGGQKTSLKENRKRSTNERLASLPER